MSHLTDCPICLDTFQHPKILPCSHTFCLRCLEQYSATQLNSATQSPKELMCPTCKLLHTIPDRGIQVCNNFFCSYSIIVIIITFYHTFLFGYLGPWRPQKNSSVTKLIWTWSQSWGLNSYLLYFIFIFISTPFQLLEQLSLSLSLSHGAAK